MAKDEAELAKLRSKSQSLTERAAELEAAMEGAGGEPLRAARARVAKLQKARTRLGPSPYPGMAARRPAPCLLAVGASESPAAAAGRRARPTHIWWHGLAAQECDACEKEVARVGVAAAAAERAATKLTADASKARRDAAAASEAQATAMAAFKQLEEAAFACLQVRSTAGVQRRAQRDSQCGVAAGAAGGAAADEELTRTAVRAMLAHRRCRRRRALKRPKRRNWRPSARTLSAGRRRCGADVYSLRPRDRGHMAVC